MIQVHSTNSAHEMLEIEFETLTLSLTHIQKQHIHTLLFNCNLGGFVDFSTALSYQHLK